MFDRKPYVNPKTQTLESGGQALERSVQQLGFYRSPGFRTVAEGLCYRVWGGGFNAFLGGQTKQASDTTIALNAHRID